MSIKKRKDVMAPRLTFVANIETSRQENIGAVLEWVTNGFSASVAQLIAAFPRHTEPPLPPTPAVPSECPQCIVKEDVKHKSVYSQGVKHCDHCVKMKDKRFPFHTALYKNCAVTVPRP